ncbi:hypothetical protein ACJX0J_041841, partial [Zea mays]
EAYANDLAAGRLQGYDSRLAANACGQREWEDTLCTPTGSPTTRSGLRVNMDINYISNTAYPPDYVAATRDFGRRTRELTSTLVAILSMGLLGTDRGDALEKALTTTATRTAINYYPRCPQPELAVGVEAHTDVSALSFILHNGVPGLQPGTIIVHVGDALEILSNGRYTSVLHRGLVNREA